jgi:hypothetical protein
MRPSIRKSAIKSHYFIFFSCSKENIPEKLQEFSLHVSIGLWSQVMTKGFHDEENAVFLWISIVIL